MTRRGKASAVSGLIVRSLSVDRQLDLIPNALPFGRLWYDEPNAVANAVDYAKFVAFR
jgi:hypothetical protein